MPAKSTSEFTPKEVAKFWETVQKTPHCWIWKGALDKRNSCGRFYRPGSRLRSTAHKVAWELVNERDLSAGEQLSRRCDTRACVRPDHYEAKLKKKYVPKPPKMRPTSPEKPEVDDIPASRDPEGAKYGRPDEPYMPPLGGEEHRKLLDIVARAVLDSRKLAAERAVDADAAAAERSSTLGRKLVALEGQLTELLSVCRAQGEQIGLLTAAVGQLRGAASKEPEPAAPPPPAESSDQAVESAPGGPTLAQLLMSAFRDAVDDVPQTVPEDFVALERAFDHALSETGGGERATARFQEWLVMFQERETGARTPERFCELVLRGELAPPLAAAAGE